MAGCDRRKMSMRETTVPKSFDSQRTKAKMLPGAKDRTRLLRSSILLLGDATEANSVLDATFKPESSTCVRSLMRLLSARRRAPRQFARLPRSERPHPRSSPCRVLAPLRRGWRLRLRGNRSGRPALSWRAKERIGHQVLCVARCEVAGQGTEQLKLVALGSWFVPHLPSSRSTQRRTWPA